MSDWWNSDPVSTATPADNWWAADPVSAASSELKGRPYVPYTKAPPGLPPAFTDVPKEIAGAAREGLNTLHENTIGQGGKPPLDFTKSIGSNPFDVTAPFTKETLAPARAAAGGLGIAASPITGTARSLIGHPYSELTGIPYEQAKPVVDLAMSAMGPGRGPLPARVPNVPQLEARSAALYQSPEVTGVVLHPQTLTNTVESLIQNNRGRINPHTTQTTWNILQDARTAPPGSTATMQDIRDLREVLGGVYSPPSPLNNARKENAAATLAIQAIDDMMRNTPAQSAIAGNPQEAAAILAEANANYGPAQQARMLERKQFKAQMDAETANSGMNFENKMRRVMADLTTKPAEGRGMSPEALAEAESIARGTRAQNTLRGAGNILGGGGGLGMNITGAGGAAIGAVLGGPVGAAVGTAAFPALGWTLKSIGNALTMRQVGKLSEMIRADTPLGRSMEASANDWKAKYSTLQSSPSYANFAAFNLASRNLAHNLASAGVEISPTTIMRAIQGPKNAPAENEQPEPPRVSN